jgi:replicative DNA helicase
LKREDAELYIKDDLPNYLTARGLSLRKPFRCLNPDHSDSHPSMSYDVKRNKVHCFSCGADYSTIDLIGIEYGLTDNAEIFKKAYELYNIEIDTAQDDFSPVKDSRQYKTPLNEFKPRNQKIDDIEDLEEPDKVYDFTKIIEEAHKELLNTPKAMDYYRSRGLSDEIIKEYKLGYCKDGYNSLLKDFPELHSQGKKQGLYKYVLPYINDDKTCNYFITEITDRSQVDEYNGKYRKIKDIKAYIFNERYIVRNSLEVIFICEGIYDALSVEMAGGKAIAFIGTAHRRFLSLCKKYKPKSKFIIMLDNDGAGQKAVEAVKEGLNILGIDYAIHKPNNGKDANESLQNDKEAFVSDIAEAIRKAVEQEKLDYLNNSALKHIAEFKNGINESVNTPAISTGFLELNNMLDGGFYEGLYILGAISSLGKTTFALQVADQIARAGHDVLFFSLEMSRFEVMAKSISRLTFIESKFNKELAKTTRGILAGKKYRYYSQEEKDLIRKSVEVYSQFAGNMYIYEGRYVNKDGTAERMSVAHIRELVNKHVTLTGRKPVVFIDYLQIIAPTDIRATDKQNTDIAVFELKEISRDFKIPVVAISSFNRENYSQPVSMASFKESGAIEYSSDVLLGLQYSGMEYLDGENEKERTKRIRELFRINEAQARNGEPQEIDLKILKQRNGAKGSIGLYMTAKFNYFDDFRPIEPEETPFDKPVKESK